MLQDQGRDPHIVCRDRSALLAQLPVDGAIVMRGLFIGIEHSRAGRQKKMAEDSLIFWSLSANGKSGAQFSHYDEGQPHLIGVFDNFDNRLFAPAKVSVAVRIKRQFHRHLSSSMAS